MKGAVFWGEWDKFAAKAKCHTHIVNCSQVRAARDARATCAYAQVSPFRLRLRLISQRTDNQFACYTGV